MVRKFHPLGLLSFALLLLGSPEVIALEETGDGQTACGASLETPFLQAMADRGDTGAMVYLGRKLLEQACSEADYDAGLNWLDRAAQASDPEALFLLGKLLVASAHSPEETDFGLSYLERSAQLRHPEAAAFWGAHLMSISRSLQEREVAFFWLGQAASDGSVIAAMTTAHLFQEGQHGVQRDTCSAALWRQVAVLVQHPELEQDMSSPDACE
ncbi:MAG: hypothetical protein AAF636_18495 [Pseudomonadota bacterium]